ncbi:MAG: methionyl-tRNA formyltransferase [Acidobacteriales bacterium]|nr:methionyl-tRNA formyltransferase [Terriglobales bacterium]
MPAQLNLVFCGTPAFAVPTLSKLVEAGHLVHLVVTQPDRPSGRGLTAAASPVKQRATELGIPITQPEKIKANEQFRAVLESLSPDAIIVVGYGRIIPRWMIDLPRFGNINLHGSLLPKYRGAAPIQWAIARGETTTGVTTMQIDEGLDTGPVLECASLPIEPQDTAETLAPRLAAIGAELMISTLSKLADHTLRPTPQDHAHATVAPILRKDDGLIDFQRSATDIFNRLRGFQPWPGAYTTFRGKSLHIRAAVPVTRTLPPGELFQEGVHLYAGCGEHALELLELQPEGKRRIPVREFISGYRPRPGEQLGDPAGRVEGAAS